MTVAQRGAAAAPHLAPSPTDASDSTRPNSTRASSVASTATNSSFRSVSNKLSSKNTEGDSGVTVEIALKVIPKKKVKGNEDSVWGEMEVLKGLDHKNIVSSLVGRPMMPQDRRASLRSSSTSGSNLAQSTTYRSNSLSAENYLSVSQRKANLLNPTPYKSFVRYCPGFNTSTSTTSFTATSSKSAPTIELYKVFLTYHIDQRTSCTAARTQTLIS